jgi:hypothetical protein
MRTHISQKLRFRVARIRARCSDPSRFKSFVKGFSKIKKSPKGDFVTLAAPLGFFTRLLDTQ